MHLSAHPLSAQHYDGLAVHALLFYVRREKMPSNNAAVLLGLSYLGTPQDVSSIWNRWDNRRVTQNQSKLSEALAGLMNRLACKP